MIKHINCTLRNIKFMAHEEVKIEAAWAELFTAVRERDLKKIFRTAYWLKALTDKATIKS